MAGFELFDDLERKEVQEVMETGILMRYGFGGLRKGRYKASEMEAAISEKVGVKHTLLLSSGTAALSTALAALGVGAGDEVIMPTFTFVASFESIMLVGAIPVLVDIDETLCLDPKAVRKAITPKTKVIMPVHMCGAAAQIDELRAICDEHKLILLEDACQAFGASFNGKMLGSIGDAGCYSFDFNKLITCGEGGAVVTKSKQVYERADMYHDHGHDHSNEDRGAEGHPYPGFNFRISELNAAFGCGQIKKLERFLEIQRKSKKILKDALSTVSGVEFRRLPDPKGDSATFLSFFMPTEELAVKAIAALKQAGVDGAFHWYNNNWHYIRKWDHFKDNKFIHPLYREMLELMPDYSNKKFEQSDRIMARTISLNIKLGRSENEVKQIADKLVMAIESVLE